MGHPISTVYHSAIKPFTPILNIGQGWNGVRDSAEALASLAGNYYLPGSSVLTSHLVSKGAQNTLNSPVGQLGQLATGASGAGIGSANTGIPASNGWSTVGNAVKDATGLTSLNPFSAAGATNTANVADTANTATTFGGIPSGGAGAGGNIAQNVAGSSSSLGSNLLGAYAINSLSSSLSPQTNQTPVNQTPAAFVPKQQDAQGLPGSLQGFGGLDSGQQESNLANQGTYGGGLGPQENSYFLNLINRHLVDQSGKTSSASSLSPISQSYLQKLGFGGYGNNTNSLLEAISKWKNPVTA